MNVPGFGLIGCGVWGSVHARTYAASPSAHLVTVCDQDTQRAERFAQQYGADSFCTDWHHVLSDPAITGVSITTPDFLHSEIVVAALESGKHVLVEKPLAATVEACQKILAARDASGTKLMVDFHNRWNPPFVHVRRMVESGELGQVLMINLRLQRHAFCAYENAELGARSSPAHFLGSHLVDVVRWISGAEVKRVYSVARSVVLRKKGIDTPDFYQSILELSTGGTAVLETCWILAEGAPSVFEFKGEFVGEKGNAYVNASHHRMIEKYTERGSGMPDVLGIVELFGKPAGFCIASIEHFIDCVVRDLPPAVTGEDGLAATRVVQAMEESARAGQPIEL